MALAAPLLLAHAEDHVARGAVLVEPSAPCPRGPWCGVVVALAVPLLLIHERCSSTSTDHPSGLVLVVVGREIDDAVRVVVRQVDDSAFLLSEVVVVAQNIIE